MVVVVNVKNEEDWASSRRECVREKLLQKENQKEIVEGKVSLFSFDRDQNHNKTF